MAPLIFVRTGLSRKNFRMLIKYPEMKGPNQGISTSPYVLFTIRSEKTPGSGRLCSILLRPCMVSSLSGFKELRSSVQDAESKVLCTPLAFLKIGSILRVL